MLESLFSPKMLNCFDLKQNKNILSIIGHKIKHWLDLKSIRFNDTIKSLVIDPCFSKVVLRNTYF